MYKKTSIKSIEISGNDELHFVDPHSCHRIVRQRPRDLPMASKPNAAKHRHLKLLTHMNRFKEVNSFFVTKIGLKSAYIKKHRS